MTNQQDNNNDPRAIFERIAHQVVVEIDPAHIDESVQILTEKVRNLVGQGRYTKVRVKYKGKPLMPDIPMGVFLAAEAVTFWYSGLLRALVVNLGVRTLLEVELIHDADEKVAQGVQQFMDGDVDEAERCYRDALAIKPDDTSALVNLGILLRVTGRQAEAIDVLTQAAADTQHPDSERARIALEKIQGRKKTL
jgi:tetratricopeptide (TPR) repeat protein